MKKLIVMAVAMAAAVALAQAPAGQGPKGYGARGERGHGPMAERGRGPMMPREMMPMGGAMHDPVVAAVMNPRVAEAIGLSDEQKAKLAEFKTKRGENREINEKIRLGMQRQMELLKAEPVDEAAVMAAIDEVFEARKEVAKAQTRRLIAVRAILTPAQIAKAREELAKGRQGARRPPMRGEGELPPPPPAPEAE